MPAQICTERDRFWALATTFGWFLRQADPRLDRYTSHGVEAGGAVDIVLIWAGNIVTFAQRESRQSGVLAVDGSARVGDGVLKIARMWLAESAA
jgi:hypothetical protein